MVLMCFLIENAKHCPFCEKRKALPPEFKYYKLPTGEDAVCVSCPTCGCRGPSYYAKYEKEALDDWNKRSQE